jgi:DNA integrity scanning protein DisA with diadenylate cyclase activity
MQAIKNVISDVKKLGQEGKQLQANLAKLQKALPLVTEYQQEVTTLIDKWKFKDQHRLDRIQEIVEKLNKQFK